MLRHADGFGRYALHSSAARPVVGAGCIYCNQETDGQLTAGLGSRDWAVMDIAMASPDTV